MGHRTGHPNARNFRLVLCMPKSHDSVTEKGKSKRSLRGRYPLVLADVGVNHRSNGQVRIRTVPHGRYPSECTALYATDLGVAPQ